MFLELRVCDFYQKYSLKQNNVHKFLEHIGSKRDKVGKKNKQMSSKLIPLWKTEEGFVCIFQFLNVFEYVDQ